MQSHRFYTNNFNLIRLFAAMQVVHYHLVSIFKIEATEFHLVLLKILGFFPGVPVFFFISGFLISKSWETSKNWKDYAIKRAARIEPALLVSVLLAIALIYTTDYFGTQGVAPNFGQLAVLALSKTTIVQFYNPEYLRQYGDGVLNGSLWTITVEIQFYLLIPFIYILARRHRPQRIFIALLFIFVGANLAYDFLYSVAANNITTKLIRVTFAPWIFMFLAGVLFQRNFDTAYKYLNGRFIQLLLFYLITSYIALQLGADFGNSLNPIMFILLAMTIFSAAYTNVTLADKTLKGIDISYGTYLYHMPIINWCIYSQIEPSYASGVAAMTVITLLSLASWLYVEKPSLRLAKRHVNTSTTQAKKRHSTI